MGLDITAYRSVKKIKDFDDMGFDYEESNQIGIVFHPAFPKQADGLTDGIYEHDGVEFDFRAGSYSWYNKWREELAKMVGTTPEKVWANPDPTIPFVELINFADNEGVIGSTTSLKLYNDFVKHSKKAKEHKCNDDDEMQEWFMKKYYLWKRAFKLASNGGCVRFH